MERRKASDFPQELIDLLNGYVHGGISRRQFLSRAERPIAVVGETALEPQRATHHIRLKQGPSPP